MMIITLLFFLQLNNYNSILRTKYDYVNAPGGVPGYAMNQEWHVWKIMKVALPQYDVDYMIMQGNMTMMKRVIINEMVESCMAIYLGMAMEMP